MQGRRRTASRTGRQTAIAAVTETKMWMGTTDK